MIAFVQGLLKIPASQNQLSNPKSTVYIAIFNDWSADFEVFMLLILEATSAEFMNLRNTNSEKYQFRLAFLNFITIVSLQ